MNPDTAPTATPAPVPVNPAAFRELTGILVPVDVRRTANRLSCDQDIAADGLFSLGCSLAPNHLCTNVESGSIAASFGSAG